MAERKRETATEINALLEEADFIMAQKKLDKKEYVKQTMDFYIREKKRLDIIKQLKQGYKEMSDINLALAESGMQQDVNDLYSYEEHLVGEFV